MPSLPMADAPLTRTVDSGVSEQKIGRLIRVIREGREVTTQTCRSVLP
jgi:hypothetical protein